MLSRLTYTPTGSIFILGHQQCPVKQESSGE